MKKILLICLLLCSHVLFAQTVPDFDLIKLEKAGDYKPAEPYALQTAVYLLSTPAEKGSENRLKSLQFLLKWMSGTPDHSFVLDQSVSKLIGDDKNVLGIYMAAMVKFALSGNAAARDAKAIKLNAINSLLDYCENKNNNIKMGKQLKKLSGARAKGELEQLF